MAIATAGTAVTFTAVNEKTEEWPDLREIVGMSFSGTGLTAGQRLTVRGGTNGAPAVGSGTILADYRPKAADDSADLWHGRAPQPVRGISIDKNTVAGTWVLTVFFR
jgi:hypothetical protein